MDLFELQTKLGFHAPAERGTDEPGAEVIHAILGVAQHDSEVFRYVLEQDMQRMHLLDDRLVVQDAIVQDVTSGC